MASTPCLCQGVLHIFPVKLNDVTIVRYNIFCYFLLHSIHFILPFSFIKIFFLFHNVYYRYIESGCYRGFVKQVAMKLLSSNLHVDPEKNILWNVYTNVVFQLKQNQCSSHSQSNYILI